MYNIIFTVSGNKCIDSLYSCYDNFNYRIHLLPESPNEDFHFPGAIKKKTILKYMHGIKCLLIIHLI